MAGKPQTLSEGQKKEVVRLFWKKFFTSMLIFFAILGGITGLSLWEIKQRVEAKMEELVAKQFEEPQIQEVVRKVAAERASALMTEQIMPEVTKFKDEIKKNQEEYFKVLIESKEQQEKQAEIISLNLLAIAAVNGDKDAFFKLNSLTRDANSKYYSFAVQLTTKVYFTYFGNFSFSSERYYLAKKSDEEVVEQLNSEIFLERKIAVNTIKRRKMYVQVPKLIAMIKSEPTLDVLAAIGKALNDLLGTNIKIIHEEAQDDFTKTWLSKKPELLKATSTN